MSTEKNQQNQTVENTEVKSRVITCFIYYNSDEELSKIFEVINDFRTRHGLKYSHHSGYIFFNLLSDHLNEFGKVRPFRVSKYKTSSEYTCSKEVADKIMEKKNSFIHMSWNEEGFVSFNSRTIARVHSSLVYKIFKESGIEYSKDSHKILKPVREQKDYAPRDEKPKQNNSGETPDTPVTPNTPNTPNTSNTDNTGFIKVEKRTKSKNPRDSSKYNSKAKEQSQDTPKIRGRNNK